MAPSINFLAVLVAVVAAFMLGWLWYSPMLFAKAWMKEHGFTEQDLQGKLGLVFGLAFILILIMALNLAAFLGSDSSLGWGLAAGALAGVGWVATALGVTYLFERRSLRLFLIDAGYHAVSFTVMGGIIALLS